MCGSYFSMGSNLKKCENLWKNGRFSGRIWPDWGYTTLADLAGLGSIGLRSGRDLDIVRVLFPSPFSAYIQDIMALW